jgi:putative transposase
MRPQVSHEANETPCQTVDSKIHRHAYNASMEHYRIVQGVGLYYVTFTVVEWLPVFIDEPACKIITDSFNFCIENKHLGVNAYVIMPTHLHTIGFDIEFNSERLKQTLDNMRKFTGRQLLEYSAKHLPESFTEVFRNSAGKDRERRFWQPTQHQVGIVSDGFWKQKMDYLHHNPCRKGLVLNPEDWRFSSARYWLKGEQNDVQLSDVGWE